MLPLILALALGGISSIPHEKLDHCRNQCSYQDADTSCAMVCTNRHYRPKKKVVKAAVKPCCNAQPVTIIVKQEQNQNQNQAMFQGQTLFPDHPWLHVGVFGGVGAAWCVPSGAFGDLGLRLKFGNTPIGAQVYTEFYWGSGASLLLYPVYTGGFNWHINGGVHLFQHLPYVLPNVPRTMDLTVGTGIEVRILPHLYLTGDLRTRIPNPVAVAALKNLHAGHTVAQAFAETQFMIGLMLGN